MKRDSKILFVALALGTFHSIAQVAPPQQPMVNQSTTQTYGVPVPTSPTMAPLDSASQPLPDQTLTRPVPGADNSQIPLDGQSLSNPYQPGMQRTPTSGWFNLQPGSRTMNEQQMQRQQLPQPPTQQEPVSQPAPTQVR
jgi:hypothetical protein